MKKRIGIIFADSMEYAPFEKYARKYDVGYKDIYSDESFSFSVKHGGNEAEIIAIKAGVGKTNVAMATALLIGCENADIILNAGLSGAVSGCRRSDIMVGETYVECDFDLTAIGYKPGEKPDGQKYVYSGNKELVSIGKKCGAKVGALGSGDVFLTDREKKNYYKNTFSINAFDMETGAIAAVCDKCNIPFMSVRKISDDAEDAAYESYREMNEAQEECLSEFLMRFIEKMLDEEAL